MHGDRDNEMSLNIEAIVNGGVDREIAALISRIWTVTVFSLSSLIG